jgi:hypothetical protein
LDDKTEKDFVKNYFSKIFMHPDWNATSISFDADIAVVLLKNEIKFTDFIQPICLPGSIQNIVGTKGFVAGYGFENDISNFNTNRPKHTSSEIKEDRECIYEYPILGKVGSLR